MASFTVGTTVEAEAEIDIEISDVTCDLCGEDLGFTAEMDGGDDISIRVDPCECILKEDEEPEPPVQQPHQKKVI